MPYQYRSNTQVPGSGIFFQAALSKILIRLQVIWNTSLQLLI